MKQIYDLSEMELHTAAAEYMRRGAWERAAMCMEQILLLGMLPRYGYLRLAILYIYSEDKIAAKKIISRYCKLRKY